MSQYWLYGKHPIISTLNNPCRTNLELLLTPNAKDYLVNKGIDISKVSYKLTTNQTISKLIKQDEAAHQGICLKTKILKQPLLEELDYDEKATIILLDKVSDPGNIGAIIRNAAAFEAQAVITTKDGSPYENAGIVKSSAGTFEQVPYIHATNLTRCIEHLKEHNFWSFALTQRATANLDILREYPRKAIILGAEGKGIRPNILKACDMEVRINISQRVESLNVSNAAAVCLFASFSQ